MPPEADVSFQGSMSAPAGGGLNTNIRSRGRIVVQCFQRYCAYLRSVVRPQEALTVPALPDAPNVIRIRFEYTTEADLKAGNRIFYLYSGGPPSVAQLNTLATDVSTGFGTDLAPEMSQNYALTGVECTDLTSPTSAQGTWTGSVPGTRSSASVDNTLNDAVIHNFVIARRYRGGKPKTFWPFGVSGDRQDDAHWHSSFATEVENAWASFKTYLQALTGIGCTLTDHVNVSYYSGFASVQNPVTKRWENIPTPRTGTAVIDGITGNSVNLMIGSQRRRRSATSY